MNIFRYRIKDAYKVMNILYVLGIILGKFIRYYYLKVGTVYASPDFLVDLIRRKYTLATDDTFNKFANVYRAINIFHFSTVMEFEIFFSISLNILVLFILYRNRDKINRINLFGLIVLFLSSILLNTYVLGMAKEPLVFLSFYLVYLTINKVKNNKLLCIFLLIDFTFVAYLLKTYYLLVLFFAFIILYLLDKKNAKKKSDIILLLVGATIFYVVMIVVLKKISYESYLKIINLSVDEYEEASSKIVPIFKNNSNLMYVAINYMVKVVRLLIPIELMSMGAKYVPYVAFQIMLFFIVIYYVNRFRTIEKNKYYLAVFIGFIFTSAMFEPDFGSWIRHEMSVFCIFMPLVLDAFQFDVINDKHYG